MAERCPGWSQTAGSLRWGPQTEPHCLSVKARSSRRDQCKVHNRITPFHPQMRVCLKRYARTSRNGFPEARRTRLYPRNASFYNPRRTVCRGVPIRRGDTGVNLLPKTLIVALVTASGLGCANTRLPSLDPVSPSAERLDYQRHYGLPEADAGPEVQALPRGFEQQRVEPTRIQREPRTPFFP